MRGAKVPPRVLGAALWGRLQVPCPDGLSPAPNQVTSQDKAPAVIRKAMDKHHLDGAEPELYELVQVISDERSKLGPAGWATAWGQRQAAGFGHTPTAPGQAWTPQGLVSASWGYGAWVMNRVQSRSEADRVAYGQQKLISHGLEAGSPRWGCQTGPVRALSAGVCPLLAVSAHREGGVGPLVRALIPLTGLHPHELLTPQSPTSRSHYLGS